MAVWADLISGPFSRSDPLDCAIPTGRPGPGSGTTDCSGGFEGDDTKLATVELAVAGDGKDAGMAAVGFILASAAGVRFTSTWTDIRILVGSCIPNLGFHSFSKLRPGQRLLVGRPIQGYLLRIVSNSLIWGDKPSIYTQSKFPGSQ